MMFVVEMVVMAVDFLEAIRSSVCVALLFRALVFFSGIFSKKKTR